MAGLYHFTVKSANATKEGTDSPNTVDIGFHYAGVDGNSAPNDTDGDGEPDYWEDRNGDGSISGDLTAFTSYDSPNLTTAGLPVLFTPAK